MTVPRGGAMKLILETGFYPVLSEQMVMNVLSHDVIILGGFC